MCVCDKVVACSKVVFGREVCARVVCVCVCICTGCERCVWKEEEKEERMGVHNRKTRIHSHLPYNPRILNALKVLGLGIYFLPQSRSCCCRYLERSEMEGSVVRPTAGNEELLSAGCGGILFFFSIAMAKSTWQLCNTAAICNIWKFCGRVVSVDTFGCMAL